MTSTRTDTLGLSTRRRTRAQLARHSATIALVVAAVGCTRDTPQTTLMPRSDFARAIHGVYGIIAWVAAGIAVVVLAVLVWVLLRYRERSGTPLPAQTRGHTGLEIAWTLAPALVLLVIAVPTIRVVFQTQGPTPPGALEINVRAWQWWWEFRYSSLGIVTANEMHVPVGRTIRLRLEGPDVIHSFWVPQLGGKRDVVPGRINYLTFTPEAPGQYRGQCAEFCGTSHANMRLRVMVEAPEAFDRWAVRQKAQPIEPTESRAAEGKAIYARNACVGCHTIAGISEGRLAPNLSHFGSRSTFAGATFPATAENVAAWLKDPPALKPGAKMPVLPLTNNEAEALAAYLVSLK
jgi:cytochrome c oxidase subunit 2